MAGQISVGNNSVISAFVGDDRVIAIFYGHTLIYVYVGYTLIDANDNYLLDSDGNNLLCL